MNPVHAHVCRWIDLNIFDDTLSTAQRLTILQTDSDIIT